MSDITVENLQLEIQAPSAQAEKSIDNLAETLGKLKNATKNLGLTRVAKQVSTLNTSLNGVSSENAEKLNRLAQSLQTLSQCGTLKLSPSVSTQLVRIGDAVRKLGGTDFSVLHNLSGALAPLSSIGKANLNSFISQLNRLPQAVQALNAVDMSGLRHRLTELVSALSPLTQMGKNNLTSFVTQLQKLPQVMSSLQSVDMGALGAKIRELASALSPLAREMQSITNGFSAFPARIQRLIASTNSLSTANHKASLSYVNLAAKISIAVVAMRQVVHTIGKWITKSNEYVESLNLFTVSLGEYAAEAQKYAENVAEIMGIDPAEWLRNQGVFMTLATGFGVVNDRAYTMSKNLTQLGYDLSSFFNISYEDAFQKLQSGISGELEPLRRLGYDLSVARLQQEAYTLGIEKNVNAMTQAEKAELRYYAIMTQVTTAQGDMARTLEAPANQLRILRAQVDQAARALGNIFIPVLNAVLPYAIALAKAIRMVADVISGLFGFKLPEIDYSGVNMAVGGAADGAGDLSDNLGNAAKKAKEVKNALLGIDELNVISPPEDSAGGGTGLGGIGGGGLGFELPTYDFLGNALSERVNEILQKMKEWLGLTEDIDSWSDFFHTRLGRILTTVGAIALGFAAWKLSDKFMKAIALLKTLGLGGTIPIAIGITVGSIALEWSGIIDAIRNGLTDMNFAQIIAGAIGTVFGGATFGKLLWKPISTALAKVAGNSAIATSFAGPFAATLFSGGLAAVVAGLPAFVTGVWDSIQNGISWLSALLTEFGSTLVGGGAGAIGAALGAWGGPIGIAVGALIGVVVGALTNFGIWLYQNWEEVTAWFSEKWNGVVSWWNGTVVPFFKGIPEWFGGILTSIGNWFTEKWTAIVDFMNGIPEKIGNVITSIGEWFSELPGKIGYALGYALGKVVGWVTDTYDYLREKIPETIEKVKQWFSALPEKIWNAISSAITKVKTWGTNVWSAFKEKVDSIVTSVTSWFAALPNKIYQAIITVKDKIFSWASQMIETVKTEVPKIIEQVVGFFKEIPEKLWNLGSDIINGLLDGIKSAWEGLKNGVSDFCGNFVQGFKDALGINSPSRVFMQIGGYSVDGLVEGVNGKSSDAQGAFQTLAGNILSWFNFGSTGVNAENFAAFASNAITGFGNKVSSFYSTVRTSITTWATSVKSWFTNSSFGGVNGNGFATFATDVVNGFKNRISSFYTTAKSSVTTWATGVKNWFSDIASSNAFAGFATNVINGFKNKISSGYTTVKSSITTWASSVMDWFGEKCSYNSFYNVAADVINGFKNGIGNLYHTVKNTISSWGSSIISWFKERLDSNSPSKVFEQIGIDTVLGYNLGISNLGKTTKGVVDAWANSFTSVSPVMRFAVDTSALKYYTSDSFAKEVGTKVSASGKYAINGSFSLDGMKEAVMQALRETGLVDDVRRQADKNEQTIVQIGNRTVTDAVTTQRKSNGYVFVR